MACKKQELYKAYLHMLELAEIEASNAMEMGCSKENLTAKQVAYLRIIDCHQALTCSDLAQYTENSKPTVTEMVNKFIARDCVIKRRSDEDRRICFIQLTPKGERIARSDEIRCLKVVDHITQCLSESEIDLLITLLNKL